MRLIYQLMNWLEEKRNNMDLQIIENNDAVYTKEHIEHLREYGQKAYGLNVKEDWLKKQMEKIRNGCPDKRIDPSYMRCFEIFYNKQPVGDITICIHEFDDPEISIVVFKKFSGNKIAQNAIKKLLNEIIPRDYNKIGAVVRKENNESSINTVLKKCGFVQENNEYFYFEG